MLNRYRKTYEKIAMGLLSFMPNEKNLKVLQETIRKYESDTNWELYLYKRDEDYIGLVGIEKQEQQWIVRHISVDPSHRNEGLGKLMVQQLAKLDATIQIKSCEITEPFIEKCLQSKEEADMPI